MHKKKVMILSLTTLFLLVGCGKKEEIKEPSKDIETNKTPISDKVLDDFSFTNTNIVVENNHSTLTTKVTNNSSEDKSIEQFKIIIKDKDGNVMKETIGYIGGVIKSKESKTIITGVNMSLTDTYDIEYSY